MENQIKESKYIHVPIHGLGQRVQIERLGKEHVPLMLRARTALAYCFYNKLLVSTRLFPLHTLWYPANMSESQLNQLKQEYLNALSVMTPEQVGGMLILRDETAGWNDQPCTIVLMDDIAPSELERAFEPSMRWLNDRPSIKSKLASLWSKETNGTV